MATNKVFIVGTITEIPDSQTGQAIYADLATWDGESEDHQFNNWSTSPGSSQASITLKIVNVEDADIEAEKQNLRDLLDGIDSDHSVSHEISRFEAKEV